MIRFRVVKSLILWELTEALRSRWLVAYALSYLLFGLSLTQFSLMGVSYLGLQAVGRIMATLINLSLYLVPLISLVLGCISIVGEKEVGIVEWLFSEPIGVLDYVLGKYLGLLIAISVATFLGFGLASWVVVVALPATDLHKYLMFIVVAILLSMACLSIGMMISASSKSRFEALGLAFLVWFTMIFVYDLMVMGMTISMGLRESEVFTLAVANPVEDARILMIYFIDPMLTFLGPHGAYAVRELGEWLPLALSLILAIYAVVILSVTIFVLKGKDLIA